ncbi:MAG: hypothetical protein Kow00104_16350 [Rhodothalassiaceae bacterium]
MKNLKKIGAALAIAGGVAFASGGASAVPVTVGGVTWDPASAFDLGIFSAPLRETAVSNIGDELKGFGLVTNINNTTQNTFCVGCELTFVFDGFFVSDLIDSNSDTIIDQVVFQGGSVRFYVDKSPDFTAADSTSAGPDADTKLWLEIAGHTSVNPLVNGGATPGTLFSFLSPLGTVSAPGIGSIGQGVFDAVGGLAMPNFDTNTIVDFLNGFADFSFTSSFQFQPQGNPDYPIAGTGELFGDSIPEPATLALVGAGLMGFGFARRRRAAK